MSRLDCLVKKKGGRDERVKQREESGLLVVVGEPLYGRWKSIMPFLFVLR